MKKLVCLIFLFSGISISQVCAQSAEYNREKIELAKLVKARDEKFGSYAKAAEAKTGFFGNKTKSDLRKQNEILTEIIKTDNHLIFLLNNFLDYRTFQKTEMVYSQAELDQKASRLDAIVENLAVKLKTSDEQLKQKNLELKRLELVNIILIAAMLIGFIVVWRKKRAATSQV